MTDPQTMTDILDIEGIVTFPWEKVFVGLGIGVAVVLLALFIYWAVRKWKNSKRDPWAHLSPEQRALKRWEQLKKSADDPKAFSFGLSEIVRRYLEEGFSFLALEKTTPEILQQLSSVNLNTPAKSALKDLLLQTDQIKFAGESADLAFLSQLLLDFLKKAPVVVKGVL